MPPLILKAEQLGIDAERTLILSSLRTGDFNKQRLACDRLSALAENHFPDFLLRSVTLVSDANRLDDRVRELRITAEEEGVEVRRLIATAITLLTEMTGTTPVGRIPLEQMSPDEKATNEVRAAEIADEITTKIRLSTLFVTAVLGATSI